MNIEKLLIQHKILHLTSKYTRTSVSVDPRDTDVLFIQGLSSNVRLLVEDVKEQLPGVVIDEWEILPLLSTSVIIAIKIKTG